MIYLQFGTSNGALPIGKALPFKLQKIGGLMAVATPRAIATRVHTVNTQDQQGIFVYYIEEEVS